MLGEMKFSDINKYETFGECEEVIDTIVVVDAVFVFCHLNKF